MLHEECFLYDASHQIEALYQQQLCSKSGKKAMLQLNTKICGAQRNVNICGKGHEAFETHSTWSAIFPPFTKAFKIYREEIVA